MSNTKNILYLTSLILLMLTGCEADTTLAPLPTPGEEQVEVRFHATTAGPGASVEVSRSAFEETSLLLHQIGMYGHKYKNVPLEYKSTTTDKSGKEIYNLGTTDGNGIFYPVKDEEMYVYAYAPYSTEAYENDTDSLLVRSSNHDWMGYEHYVTDPLWASSSITTDNPTAMLTFRHQMARLQIYLVDNNGPRDYEDIWFILYFDRGQYGKMSIKTGEIISDYIGSADSYECGDYYADETLTLHPEAETTTPHYDHTILPGSKLTSIWVRMKLFDDSSVDYPINFGTAYYHRFTEENPFPAFEPGKTNKIVIKLDEIEALNNEDNE